MVLPECLLPLKKGSILLEFVLFHLLYIQNMETCCHLISICHLKLFSNTFTLPFFQEYATEFLKGYYVCWTCSKSINLNRNFWCKPHVYHVKGLTINSASSFTFFDRVSNITIKGNVDAIEFAIILYIQPCWLDYIFKFWHIVVFG